MNKTYLYVLPLALLLAGLPGYSGAQEIECVKDTTKMPKCEGEPQAAMVNLNLEKLKASPRCVRVFPGTTIVFRLTSKKNLELDTVEILPKDDFDSWLQGKNDEFNDLIIIRVPGVYNPDEPRTEEPSVHDYSITAPGKCLDPRVEVRH